MTAGPSLSARASTRCAGLGRVRTRGWLAGPREGEGGRCREESKLGRGMRAQGRAGREGKLGPRWAVREEGGPSGERSRGTRPAGFGVLGWISVSGFWFLGFVFLFLFYFLFFFKLTHTNYLNSNSYALTQIKIMHQHECTIMLNLK